MSVGGAEGTADDPNCWMDGALDDGWALNGLERHALDRLDSTGRTSPDARPLLSPYEIVSRYCMRVPSPYVSHFVATSHGFLPSRC